MMPMMVAQPYGIMTRSYYLFTDPYIQREVTQGVSTGNKGSEMTCNQSILISSSLTSLEAKIYRASTLQYDRNSGNLRSSSSNTKSSSILSVLKVLPYSQYKKFFHAFLPKVINQTVNYFLGHIE